jgi:DNA-directed RNA polymerase subunit RPC12/RpoP
MVCVVDERQGGGQDRFRDPLVSLYEMAAEDIYVVCPRCGHRATNAPRPTADSRVSAWPRRLVCTWCAYSASWSPEGSQGWCWGGPVDPFFRLPLWLRVQCCGGQTLWAFNRTHLDLLQDYVGARLRERGPESGGMTLVARLPNWIKAASNRDELLRAISRLRASID